MRSYVLQAVSNRGIKFLNCRFTSNKLGEVSTTALPPVSAPIQRPRALTVQLRASAFHESYLNRFTLLLSSRLSALGLQKPSQTFLPRRTERWTLLRGPHVDKKARDQFERITHSRLLTVRLPVVTGGIDRLPRIGVRDSGGSGSNELAYRLLRSISNVSAGVRVRAKYIASMREKA